MVYIAQCTVYCVQCSVKSLHFTDYNVQNKLYIVICVEFSVQWRVDSRNICLSLIESKFQRSQFNPIILILLHIFPTSMNDNYGRIDYQTLLMCVLRPRAFFALWAKTNLVNTVFAHVRPFLVFNSNLDRKKKKLN